jgi:hypothetical protein
MFHSTRYFWRFLVLGLAVYLLITKVPWDSVQYKAKYYLQQIEQQAREMKNDITDGLRKIGN